MNREEKLALYEKLVATSKRAMSKGASMRYTSANGNMFSFLPKRGNAAIRLPDAARAAFIKKYRAKPSVQFGAVMKDYVEVPEALLKKTAELAKFFALSVEYAYSLVPKATTRNKTEKRQRARDKAARKSAKKTAAKKTAAKKTAAKKTAAKKTAAKKTAAKKTATKKTATKKTATKKTAAKKTAAKKTATRAK
jgi:hypothetical protein